jgi:hypothetical protein
MAECCKPTASSSVRTIDRQCLRTGVVNAVWLGSKVFIRGWGSVLLGGVFAVAAVPRDVDVDLVLTNLSAHSKPDHYENQPWPWRPAPRPNRGSSTGESETSTYVENCVDEAPRRIGRC